VGAVREGAGDTRRPTVVDVSETPLSPWVSLVSRSVVYDPDDAPQLFHSLRQDDYVCVVARLSDGRLPFVRQFRPALGRTTLELPAGLRERNEDPAMTAARELYEETGLTVKAGDLQLLAVLDPDSLRLENRLWCYFVHVNETQPVASKEATVEAVALDPEQLCIAMSSGELTHALHLCAIGLAATRGLMPWPTWIDQVPAETAH
jgi:ADP-ribose pyrophosphatase